VVGRAVLGRAALCWAGLRCAAGWRVAVLAVGRAGRRVLRGGGWRCSRSVMLTAAGWRMAVLAVCRVDRRAAAGAVAHIQPVPVHRIEGRVGAQS
jgi:hypothetical protein